MLTSPYTNKRCLKFLVGICRVCHVLCLCQHATLNKVFALNNEPRELHDHVVAPSSSLQEVRAEYVRASRKLKMSWMYINITFESAKLEKQYRKKTLCLSDASESDRQGKSDGLQQLKSMFVGEGSPISHGFYQENNHLWDLPKRSPISTGVFSVAMLEYWGTFPPWQLRRYSRRLNGDANPHVFRFISARNNDAITIHHTNDHNIRYCPL